MKNDKNQENTTHYMPLCMCLGLSIGTAIGAALNNIALYMCVGMSIGVGIGSAIDAANRKKSEDSAQEPTKENEKEAES